MPRIAIISDIHANLHALEAVIADAELCECAGFVCLGDVVGYNAFPAECIRRVRTLKCPPGVQGSECPVIKGNHDAEVVSPSCLGAIHPAAACAMEWTRHALAPDELAWLQGLHRARWDFPFFSVVHASFERPLAWKYVLDAHDAFGSLVQQPCQLCFHGHTHIPKVFSMLDCAKRGMGSKPVPMRDSVLHGMQSAPISPAEAGLHDMGEELSSPLYYDGMAVVPLQEGRRYFINVGSVGQSRDGDPRACYAIYDSDSHSVIFRRLPYDVEAASQAVRDSGLPEYLADRLLVGQ